MVAHLSALVILPVSCLCELLLAFAFDVSPERAAIVAFRDAWVAELRQAGGECKVHERNLTLGIERPELDRYLIVYVV